MNNLHLESCYFSKMLTNPCLLIHLNLADLQLHINLVQINNVTFYQSKFIDIYTFNLESFIFENLEIANNSTVEANFFEI